MMNSHRFKEVLKFNNDGLITYIMSDSFRIHYNHGLLKALELSRENSKDLQIILLRKPEENENNNIFFKKGIVGHERFLSKYTNNVYYFEELSDFFYSLLSRSSHIIKDRAYLKEHIGLEEAIQKHAIENSISLTLAESNVLVPVLYASNKEEFSAHTIRLKIMRSLDQFIDIEDSNIPSFFYEQEAKDVLDIFLKHKLQHYYKSNDSSTSYISNLSVYLKYGFISPLEIYNKVQEYESVNGDSFIEEVIVKRELLYNSIYHKNK